MTAPITQERGPKTDSGSPLSSTSAIEPVPRAPSWPIVGSMPLFDRRAPMQSMFAITKRFGPIFQLDMPGRKVYVLAAREFVADACDESRFDKSVGAALRHVRKFTGDGLFTAWTDEPNWHKAHNVLLPTFSGKAMQGYLPQMFDIALQLVNKWERQNPDDEIDVGDDMTRLTLDTIGLCGFDYRFNSFYRERPHPFVDAMVAALSESLLAINRPAILNKLLVGKRAAFQKNVELMNSIVDRLIRERRADPDALATKKDLLNFMLAGKDKETGEGLSDVNIRYQIITFLIAGHETTSGLLTFAIHFLLKNPDLLAKARGEVDEVLGDAIDQPTQAQVNNLVYVHQILKESLRLWPTAPGFMLTPKQDEVLAGKYRVEKGANLMAALPALHRDPSVWGADAEAFRPERFAKALEDKLPEHAFKPFGNGQRACIGRQFALQEAALVLGMILQRFDLIDHKNYQLKIKETLTIKPEGLKIKVRLRKRERANPSSAKRPGLANVRDASAAPTKDAPALPKHGTPLVVLFGSNLGTAEEIAGRIQTDAVNLGFDASIGALDEHVGELPRQGAVVIVCSSYNGNPPDNAVRFCKWLDSHALQPGAFEGMRYAVFGCGDHNWHRTYQAVPKRIDERLAELGAKRLAERGAGDAADDFDGQFRSWYVPFWSKAAKALGLSLDSVAKKPVGYSIEIIAGADQEVSAAGVGLCAMPVLANRELQKHKADLEGPESTLSRSTRHIEVSLPEGTTYRCGDHLGVVPMNRPATVKRVLDRFHLDPNSLIKIHGASDSAAKAPFPLERPLRIGDLLSRYVELQETATREQIELLAQHTPCPPEQKRLESYLGADQASGNLYRDHVFSKHVSILELLEQCPSCTIGFDVFLAMLTRMKPRYYSISSSPIVSGRSASITVGVVKDKARSGLGMYEGVASNYLAERHCQDVIVGYVRSPGTRSIRPRTRACR